MGAPHAGRRSLRDGLLLPGRVAYRAALLAALLVDGAGGPQDVLGYTSESAFGNAFKRTVGVAPRRYRETAVN